MTPEELLSDPALFDQLLDLARRSGIAGEADLLRVLYLVVTSRLIANGRLHAHLGGESAVGKSELARFILSTLPPSAAMHLGGGASKRALQYSGDLSRKVVFIDEAEEPDQELRAFLREAVTRPEVTRLVTEGDPATGFKPRAYSARTDGFVLIQASTKVIANPADETRMLSLHPDASPGQTARILDLQAERAAAYAPPLTADLEIWRRAQDLLRPCHVIVPFARELRRFFPSDNLRCRRDFPRLLGLVRAHACLQQRQRKCSKRDGLLVVVAELEDYWQVYGFAARLFAQSTKRLTPTQEQCVKALLEHVCSGGKFPTRPTEFTTQDAAAWVQTPYTTVRDCLLSLERLGLLESGVSQGRKLWRFIADVPKGLRLPTPEELASALGPQSPQTPPDGASKSGEAAELLTEPLPVGVPQAPQAHPIGRDSVEV